MHGIELEWEPVIPAAGYLVTGAGDRVSTSVPHVVLQHLRAGHTYRIRVTVLRQKPQTVRTTGVPLGPYTRAPQHVRRIG
jgi:hypothetical protein